jgi:hypothetical protein
MITAAGGSCGGCRVHARCAVVALLVAKIELPIRTRQLRPAVSPRDPNRFFYQPHPRAVADHGLAVSLTGAWQQESSRHQFIHQQNTKTPVICENSRRAKREKPRL